MKLKNLILALTAALLAGWAVYAQTPEEIAAKMSVELDRVDSEGFSMDFCMKIPIIGEVRSHNRIHGEKVRSEVNKDGTRQISWTDGVSTWTFDSGKNAVTITEKKQGPVSDDPESGLNTLEKLTDGYDVKMQRETEDAWYLVCRKRKANPDKDAPKNIEMAVSKSTNLPIYLRIKQSGITVSLENFALGVSEDSVTFNPDDFPGVPIIDKR